MKWAHRKSWLKRWIDKHRQSCIADVVVIAFWPKKCGYYEGASVVWLSPVLKKHKSTSWKPTWCLDSGYSSWSEYEDRGTWEQWVATRPMHHLAGLVNLVVYWG